MSAPITRVAFLDVGQGDTIVVSSPSTNEAFIVDCTDADATLDYLQQERILYLRGVIITHLHADHYSGVADLLANCELVPGLHSCEVVAFNEIFNHKNLQSLSLDEDLHSSETLLQVKKNSLRDLLRWRHQNKLKYEDLKVRAGLLPFKGILADSIQLLHPYSADYRHLEAKGLNNTSIVFRVVGSGASVLLTGDLEPPGWDYLQENHPSLQSDVLKFPHHGGAWGYAETKALLDAVQPSIVVISVGTEGEKYKHPNKEVFEVLSSPPYSHIHVLCTQATNQCGGSVISQKQSVVQFLDQQAKDKDGERIGSKRGCPCAGTIIIELGEQARIVQPNPMFHQSKIIHPHFHKHKCTLSLPKYSAYSTTMLSQIQPPSPPTPHSATTHEPSASPHTPVDAP